MPRNASFDYLRFVAAIGIVVFHAGAPGAAIGYAALPFFLITLVLMAAPAARALPLAPYSEARAIRLLSPWLIWSVVYAALKAAEVCLTPATWAGEFAPAMLLTGPALHLWFLPYACIACLLIWPLVRLDLPRPVMLALWSGLGLLALWALQQGRWGSPVDEWLFAAPAVACGLALIQLRQNGRAQTIWAGVMVGLALSMSWYQGLGQLTLALGLVIAAGQIVLRPTWASRMGAQTALGIYLAHPMCLALSERAGLSNHGTLWHAVVGGTGALALVLLLPVLHKQLRRLPIVAPAAANPPIWANTKA